MYVRELADSIRSDKRLDPFLRYFLLSRTLDYAAKGNSLLRPELQATLSKLRDDKIDLAAKWMDPEDSAARAVRLRAERALESIGDKDLIDAWNDATAKAGKVWQPIFATKR